MGSKMKYLGILIFIFIFTVAAIPFDTGVVEQKSYKKGAYESVDNIDKILLYCNTKEFIKNMLDEMYIMSIAAKGTVNDREHRHLGEVEMWINSQKEQWAILFNYTHGDKSCVLGGNGIELFTPDGK